MATRYPPEFRRRAVELARRREKPITQRAVDLGVSDASLHAWLKQADIDEGRTEGLTTDDLSLHQSRGDSGRGRLARWAAGI